MEQLKKAANQYGVQEGAQMVRFLEWIGTECCERREVPNLISLALSAKCLVERFLAQDREPATT